LSALRSFLIVELAESVVGEYCGKLLADFGADVVKVEQPGVGSSTRRMSPFAPAAADPERSGLFAYLNTNKRSVTLDLTQSSGAELLAGLVARADAVIDDHPPGWLAQMGLDPQTLQQAHPKLVLCAITPFGQDAPEYRAHAEDLTVMHASGWGYHTPSAGEAERPPVKGPGRFLPSYESGLDAAMCTTACLIAARRTGRGRTIDVSMQAVMASRADYVLSQMVAGDMDVGVSRTLFDLGGPTGILPCRDGYIHVFMSAAAHWQALRTLVGDPEELREFPPNWLERGLTPERIATCRRYLAAWLKDQDKDAATAQAQALGLTLVPVNVASDLPRSPQFVHRGFFAEVEHPAQGAALFPTVPYKFGATPAQIRRHAPLLGEHTAELLGQAAASVEGRAR
jgi:crotonobetainyl-CoA:carnitine CoA-transferase CaiB-like acyl-CoA transferase